MTWAITRQDPAVLHEPTASTMAPMAEPSGSVPSAPTATTTASISTAGPASSSGVTAPVGLIQHDATPRRARSARSAAPLAGSSTSRIPRPPARWAAATRAGLGPAHGSAATTRSVEVVDSGACAAFTIRLSKPGEGTRGSGYHVEPPLPSTMLPIGSVGITHRVVGKG